jgi:hypothetical protein
MRPRTTPRQRAKQEHGDVHLAVVGSNEAMRAALKWQILLANAIHCRFSDEVSLLSPPFRKSGDVCGQPRGQHRPRCGGARARAPVSRYSCARPGHGCATRRGFHRRCAAAIRTPATRIELLVTNAAPREGTSHEDGRASTWRVRCTLSHRGGLNTRREHVQECSKGPAPGVARPGWLAYLRGCGARDPPTAGEPRRPRQALTRLALEMAA